METGIQTFATIEKKSTPHERQHQQQLEQQQKQQKLAKFEDIHKAVSCRNADKDAYAKEKLHQVECKKRKCSNSSVTVTKEMEVTECRQQSVQGSG